MPVSVSVTLIVAPGTTAPVGSLTDPEMVAWPCAQATAETIMAAAVRRSRTRHCANGIEKPPSEWLDHYTIFEGFRYLREPLHDCRGSVCVAIRSNRAVAFMATPPLRSSRGFARPCCL